MCGTANGLCLLQLKTETLDPLGGSALNEQADKAQGPEVRWEWWGGADQAALAVYKREHDVL